MQLHLRNSSLQAGYFLKAVNALGLDTGAMSGFDNKGVDNEFFKDTSNTKQFYMYTWLWNRA